jgi:hypothetical protein
MITFAFGSHYKVMHWPISIDTKPENIDNSVTVAETWGAMYDKVKAGKVRLLGQSLHTKMGSLSHPSFCRGCTPGQAYRRLQLLG